jgi:streptogramin lyase
MNGAVVNARTLVRLPACAAVVVAGLLSAPTALPAAAQDQGAAITEYVLPPVAGNQHGLGEPFGITAGADGAVWFSHGDAIGRITLGGAEKDYPIPTQSSGTGWMHLAPDRAVWFAERNGNMIGRIAVDGRVTEYPIPGMATCVAGAPGNSSVPQGITTGPDGALWFTEVAVNKVGRLQIPGVHGREQVLASSGLGTSASFTVSFGSSTPGQGEVYFGSGPGCRGLVEVATEDIHPGTTQHSVVVTGNDLPGTIGDNGIQVGATYWYETVTVTSAGTEIDTNGGKCYSVAIQMS